MFRQSVCLFVAPFFFAAFAACGSEDPGTSPPLAMADGAVGVLDTASAGPDADATPPDATPPDATAPDLIPDTLAIGEICAEAQDCESGFCADGVCCNGACEGSCRGCALEGQVGLCGNVPLDEDPNDDCAGSSTECAGSCDGAGACQFPGGDATCGEITCAEGALTSSACDGAGACERSTQSCGSYACSDDATCRTDCSLNEHCTGAAQCFGGACVSNLELGAACGTNAKVCASGFCADGVCCNTACDQDCHVCSAQGACTAEDQVPCGDASCSAALFSTFTCNQGSCATRIEPCSPYICAPTGALCALKCGSDDECLAGHYCSAAGACVATKANGEDCAASNECSSAICTAEGVCCDSACDGDCETCLGKAQCSAKPAGAVCWGVHEAVCATT
ncbi:MAG: hypothetical protein JRH20_28140, partial [Deltaproteobacteria bacterium]|nr:hypothetical protein [Deltaproteobacteria bacterium]